MKSKKQNKRKTPVFLLTIVSMFLIILMSVLVLWFAIYREYIKWEESFQNSIDKETIVLLSDTKLKDSGTKKLEKFSTSINKIDFVELSDREFTYLVGESLDTSLPLGIKYEQGYVESDWATWNIYVKTKFKNTNLPWIRLKIMKDNTESPEIYVKTISLGNFDLTDYGLKIVINNVNKGIREAILLVNESDFTGRVFRNIELEKGKVTIKGEKY